MSLKHVFNTVKNHSPLLYWIVIVHLVLAIVSITSSFMDDRTLMGVNVWMKPLKFSISVAIYILTVGFLMTLYPFSKRKKNLIAKSAEILKIIKANKISNVLFLGLSFKPETDDIRESSSIFIIKYLLKKHKKLSISAHDPVAIPNAKKAAPRSSIFTCKSINCFSLASFSAINRGAFREPGEITKLLTPTSIRSRITE